VLEGVVIDEDREFLQQAHIVMSNNDGKAIKYSFTDKNGYFKVDVGDKKGLTLTISYIGFKKLSVDLESYDFSGETVKKEYVLTSDVNLLNEIVVKPEIQKRITIIFHSR
jgi:hypothetical protein